jgi:hypothetical protein
VQHVNENGRNISFSTLQRRLTVLHIFLMDSTPKLCIFLLVCMYTVHISDNVSLLKSSMANVFGFLCHREVCVGEHKPVRFVGATYHTVNGPSVWIFIGIWWPSSMEHFTFQNDCVQYIFFL